MVIRVTTIFLAVALVIFMLFEQQTGIDIGIFPYIILAFLLPTFVYDIWRRRRKVS